VNDEILQQALARMFAARPSIPESGRVRAFSGEGCRLEYGMATTGCSLPKLVSSGVAGSRHAWKSAMTQFALLNPERFNIGIWVLTRFTHRIPDTALHPASTN
jgi:hypothetical protein